MKTITKDTPVGTRVLAFNQLSSLSRGTLVEFLDSHYVQVRFPGAPESTLNINCVYLDEPEPGTWDWACRAALAGNTMRSKSAEAEFWYCEDTDAFLKRGPGTKLEIANPSKAHVLATDWEVAE